VARTCDPQAIKSWNWPCSTNASHLDGPACCSTADRCARWRCCQCRVSAAMRPGQPTATNGKACSRSTSRASWNGPSSCRTGSGCCRRAARYSGWKPRSAGPRSTCAAAAAPGRRQRRLARACPGSRCRMGRQRARRLCRHLAATQRRRLLDHRARPARLQVSGVLNERSQELYRREVRRRYAGAYYRRCQFARTIAHRRSGRAAANDQGVNP